MRALRPVVVTFVFISQVFAATHPQMARSIEPSPGETGGTPTAPPGAVAPPSSGTTLADLFEQVRKIDPDARIQGPAAQFLVGERELILVGDEAAGRMRVMTPIAPVSDVGESVLRRMLQANFDAVLDVRYAIADGVVWSAFIHPLPPLERDEFASAVEQVWAAAETFGTTYTSGALLYRGGDSEEEHRKLIESAEDRGEPPI